MNTEIKYMTHANSTKLTWQSLPAAAAAAAALLQ